jgi:cell division septation protein DedD
VFLLTILKEDFETREGNLAGGLMRIFIIITLFLSIALFISCSEESKNEAAKLEQEMTGKDSMEQIPKSDTTEKKAAGDDIWGETLKTMEPEAVPAEELDYSVPGPTGTGYTVQVASCESMDYAKYLIGLYQERGYEPFMTTAQVNGQTYYRIRIGIFGTLGEAQALKKELEDKYSINCWIDYQM